MSNFDPPKDRLKVWMEEPRGAELVRIGNNTVEPIYLLATLTRHQAIELADDIINAVFGTHSWCSEPYCGRMCGPGDTRCRKHGGNPLACGVCGGLNCPGHSSDE